MAAIGSIVAISVSVLLIMVPSWEEEIGRRQCLQVNCTKPLRKIIKMKGTANFFS